MTTDNANRDGLMRIEEAAEYLGFAKQTLRNWVSDGRIPYVKIGRSVRFRRSELDEWVEEQDTSDARLGS